MISCFPTTTPAIFYDKVGGTDEDDFVPAIRQKCCHFVGWGRGVAHGVSDWFSVDEIIRSCILMYGAREVHPGLEKYIRDGAAGEVHPGIHLAES